MAARSPFAFILAGSVGASLNGGCMSAGGIQASRSVPVTEDSFLFASHNQVYFTQVHRPSLSVFSSSSRQFGVSNPAAFANVKATPLPALVSHSCEIQSIAASPLQDGRVLVSSVDAVGEACLSTYDPASSAATLPSEAELGNSNQSDSVSSCFKRRRMDDTSSAVMLSPASDRCEREYSWAGVALWPSGEAALVATVHSLSRSIVLFDAARSGGGTATSCGIGAGAHDSCPPLRALGTQAIPTSVSFLSPSCFPGSMLPGASRVPPPSHCGGDGGAAIPSASPLLFLTEGGQISLWDIRIGGVTSRPCVAREQASPESLWASCIGNGGAQMAVAGEDKTVYFYDPRSWKVRSRWRCPVRQGICALLLSPDPPPAAEGGGLIYAVGRDNEVMAGDTWGTVIGGCAGGRDRRGKPIDVNVSVSASAVTVREEGVIRGSALQQNHRQGFRGQSRWTGVSITSGSGLYHADEDEDISGGKRWDDVILGVCDNGTAYQCIGAQHMYPFTLG